MKKVIQQIISAFCGVLPLLLLCSSKSNNNSISAFEALLLVFGSIAIIIFAFFFQKFWKKYIIGGYIKFTEWLMNR